MDPKRFYNSFQFVNNIPGDGNSSEDDIASDSDSDYSPLYVMFQKNENIEVISEIDSETGDDIPSTSSSTQKPKRKSVKSNNLQEEILSGSSGFSYDFDIFAGEQSNTLPDGAPDLGVSGNVVTRLTSTVPRNKNHKVFFDNWFNSPLLQVYLTKIGLLPLGTARRNRVTGCAMPSEKDLKRQGRGSMMEKPTVIDGVEVSCVTWFDNKVVTLLSTYVGSSPETTREQYSGKYKGYVNIRCSKVVDV
ncbi:hypothetical protein JTB14_035462 [Gonioctena quinquepunctata]|nr:hypothetical protein JTB14_035462 [Gonioctena quinquepunctata]